MTPQEFIAKWKRANLTERSACQQHFLDLCDLLGQPKPAAADPDGTWYTFERGLRTTGGEQGWADVWLKDKFGWEYKGKHRDLVAAYQQLLKYREALHNPPLLIVCDLDRFEVHSNFTGTAKKVYSFDLDGLAEPANLDVLRRAFTDPESLRPGETVDNITENAAAEFGELADGLRSRGIEPHRAAHFLMKLMFCMFAEDIKLLRDKLFSRVLHSCKSSPKRLAERLRSLFEAMRKGGDFGADEIPWFNGGLFDDDDVIELEPDEIETLIGLNRYDWADVEPSIFGTLFERTLDPAKRAQIGAHYTSREDIETLLEPVVMAPLRREWEQVKTQCETLTGKAKGQAPKAAKLGSRKAKPKAPRKQTGPVAQREKILRDFVERLSEVRILDPACGSGNFLYVAIRLLLNLEKQVITYAAECGVGLLPQVRPTQLAGIEINPYAQELAQVVIWIGYLQWMHHNGFNAPRDPILEPIENIQLMDAILDLTDRDNPKEPEWPEADFIVGNPPFLGGGKIRGELGQPYTERLFALYGERLPNASDLCCYWLEKTRLQIADGKAKRAGLLATQGIRGRQNRSVLESIKRSGDIFFGISDRDWILDGAAVHVSMIGFDNGTEQNRWLDGKQVHSIATNLTSGVDVTKAKPLKKQHDFYHEGTKKGAQFELTFDQTANLLSLPNPNGRPNSDVIRPYVNGKELYGRSAERAIIYFPPDLTLEEAAKYEAPFQIVKEEVYPKYGGSRAKWWVHERPRPELNKVLLDSKRYIATVRHSKHRIMTWLDSAILPDSALGVFASENDYWFGMFQSHSHTVWSLAQGTQVREKESGFRYTPTTCFETFPFPDPTAQQTLAIAEAAKEMDELRKNWLNPPEWTREEILGFPGSVDGPWKRFVSEPDANGIGTVRYPRLVPTDEKSEKNLRKRTLTNLYNERPTWLDLAHKKLDAAVFAAYGWRDSMTDDEILSELLALNHAIAEREAAEPKG